MQHRISLPLGLVLLLLGCAKTPADVPLQGETATPRLRCRTELEYRPGPLGTPGPSIPVQKCEPIEVPTLPPGDLPNPGGTPAPTLQTVPAPKSDAPPAGD
jgi:hypothetical protein